MRNTTFLFAIIALAISWVKGPSLPEIPSTVPQYSYTSLSGTTPAQEQSFQPMVAPINALVMCMIERDVSYSPKDSEFLWSSLYYMIGLVGTKDWRLIELENRLLVPGEMVEDYAYVLFGYSQNLPPIPDCMTDFVEYDAEADVYIWARGDAGLSSTEITKLFPLGDNRYQIQGYFYNVAENTPLWEFAGVLIENDSMFGYQIENFALHHLIAVG